jgi:hypothetical protein
VVYIFFEPQTQKFAATPDCSVMLLKNQVRNCWLLKMILK